MVESAIYGICNIRYSMRSQSTYVIFCFLLLVFPFKRKTHNSISNVERANRPNTREDVNIRYSLLVVRRTKPMVRFGSLLHFLIVMTTFHNPSFIGEKGL